jgi:hypothetical protein
MSLRIVPGDTYYATPSYPNTKPDENASDDAAAAAMAASRRPHPSGAADTSSVNDPAGAPTICATLRDSCCRTAHFGLIRALTVAY